MTAAITAALRETELTGADGAAVALALLYAREMDAGIAASVNGRQLLEVLTALGMTPRARAAVTKGAQSSDHAPSRSKVDELRARRERRTKIVD
jgi:hypothetical protein